MNVVLLCALCSVVCFSQDRVRQLQDSLSAAAKNGNLSAAQPSGPFGFRKGMTKAEMIDLVGHAAIDQANSSGDAVIVNRAPRPHPSFAYYVVIISPRNGLVKVVGVGTTIETSAYGSELKSEFEELLESLVPIYGTPKLFDYLRAGSIWREPRDWMAAMIDKERTLEAFWAPSLPFDNRVATIGLQAEALSGHAGRISLGYEMVGFSEYSAQKKSNAAEVLK